jgi:hypothetical protein
MNALEKIQPAFLAELQQQFGHVEVICKGPDHVRLRVQLPGHIEEGSSEWKHQAKAYDAILKKHDVELVEKPVLRRGVTAIVVSGLVKSEVTI